MFRVTPLKIHILIFLSGILILSSCASKRNRLFTSPSDKLADTVKTVLVVNNASESGAYKLKPEDQITVRNLQNMEFGGGNTLQSTPTIFTIDKNGEVNLPAVGKVKLSGLTRSEAALKVQELYGTQLLKDPIIELNVINLKVTLLGEFSSTGNFQLTKENTNLIDILGEAKGLTELADPRKIKIIRGDRSNPQIIYVNLKNINSLGRPELILKNGDIIYAEKLRGKNVRNDVNTLRTVISLASAAVVILNILNRF